jgi:hypothetical protein
LFLFPVQCFSVYCLLFTVVLASWCIVLGFYCFTVLLLSGLLVYCFTGVLIICLLVTVYCFTVYCYCVLFTAAVYCCFSSRFTANVCVLSLCLQLLLLSTITEFPFKKPERVRVGGDGAPALRRRFKFPCCLNQNLSV